MISHPTEPSPRRRFSAWRAVPALAWAVVIFAVSSIPGTTLPGGFSVEGHLGEYAILGALVLFALRPSRTLGRAHLVALALCAAYAITDELHQAFVPGRMPDPIDWVTDVIGASAGIAVTLLVARWRASHRPGQ